MYNDGIYDSPDATTRQAIPFDEIDEYELEDEHGNERALYTEDGYQIQRRIAQFSRNIKAHGVLMDLSRLHEVFARDVDGDEDLWDEEVEHTKYRVYPQAGLRSVGHFQAEGLMTPCYKLVEIVNRHLHNRNRAVIENGDAWVDQEQGIVMGVGSQGYNAVTHNTRGRSAQHHEVQLGLTTGYLAGEWARDSDGQQQQRRLGRKIWNGLAHEIYADKIANPEICRDLRLENVYCVDMGMMHPSRRDGRYVCG